MTALPMLIFKVIFFLESLAPMLENGFIVTMLSGEWAPSQTLPTGDMIVACLAASRFCLHEMALLDTSWPPLAFVPKSTGLAPPGVSSAPSVSGKLRGLLFPTAPRSPSSLSRRLLDEVEDFSVSSPAAAGFPHLVWSDRHLFSCWGYNSCPDDCCPEFPWKWHHGW